MPTKEPKGLHRVLRSPRQHPEPRDLVCPRHRSDHRSILSSSLPYASVGVMRNAPSANPRGRHVAGAGPVFGMSRPQALMPMMGLGESPAARAVR